MRRRICILLIITTFISACSKDNAIEGEQPQSINKILNRQSTGSSAHDLLSDDNFTSMVIELVYVEGFEPTQSAIDNLLSFLDNRTFKPNGITIEKRSIPSPGKNIYTIEDVADIERDLREKFNTSNQIAVWALFIDGKSDKDVDNKVVLGTAYWNTSFVIYEDTVQSLSNSPFKPNRSTLESSVINHEFGHILGLTNLGSPMQSEHEDLEHPKHCNVESCLMHWTSESVTLISTMNSIPQLDAQCIADLRANGGK
ncbi:membrane metalloprotease [Tamlana sp. 2201CG12-4]|uniref:membrane metalloprotease n=1 Tax=Tamlana sp. 2201CG12-4 TaxID=3112582 RepID=UPI002DBD47B5|nr:membrane metalloprotease [Tamlana sp. 2201CG12-4]MEC3906978.1 membrane metalloprotease [Tamlana sp. 2201CG12-4]